jgi:hypothetical protein
MADLGELKIPAATRPGAEAIIALTDQVCLGLLDDEYVDLARHVVAKLARKRPSPIQSGRAPSWARGVVYALGQANFLVDAGTKPYLTADDLSAAFGVAKSTLSGKARQIRDLLKISWATPEFLREDMIEASPAIWYIRVAQPAGSS